MNFFTESGIDFLLRTSKLATAQGIDTVVTNGRNPDALFDIVNGREAGTLFAGKR